MSKLICKIDGCNSKCHAKGYCNKHYERLRLYGDPLGYVKEMNHPAICTIKGCNNVHEAKGLCSKHYLRWRKYGDPLCTKTERHGMSFTPEYKILSGMKKRCYYEKNDSYSYYGGRGITICDRWLNSFLAFFEDMGSRPTPHHQIDRIDSDGDYEPSNCRWVTPVVNNRNRSMVKLSIEKAKEVREKYKTGKYFQKDLALMYNVSQAVISCTVNGITWKEQMLTS